MSRVLPQVRIVARLLAESETGADVTAPGGEPAVFPAVDRLRPHLSMLMGRTGFQALLSRALALASVEVPWLSTTRVSAGGDLEGLPDARQSLADVSLSEGEVTLLAHLLGLLVAFIGPALTLRLMRQVWPRLSLDDALFVTSDDEDAH